MKNVFLGLIFVFIANINLFPQQVGFLSSQMVCDKIPEARIAEQRIRTMVEEWKRELKSMEEKEEAIQLDMKKNRLTWSDVEKAKKDKELDSLQTERLKYAKEKFEPNGEYDKIVKEVMKPVEEKIFK